MKRLILIDGNALLHRAYHAISPLTTSAGELVNAVYGFTVMLFRTFEQLKPDYVAVCWDRKAPTFRHVDYVGYKANRKTMDDGLSGQFERAYQILETLNIPSFGIDGYEADDLIGTLATQAANENVETVIVTGDRDALQLIDKKTKVFIPKKSFTDTVLYDEATFVTTYGFPPDNLVDFKALAGDASDNIPGVRGIGEVTARKLIGEFGSVEQVYQNLGKIPTKIVQKLSADAEAAVLSKRLATIVTDAPITLHLADCILEDYDQNNVRVLFEQLEFRSLLHRLPTASHTAEAAKQEELFGSASVVHEQDRELGPVLEAMSKKGVRADRAVLGSLEEEITVHLQDVQQKIFKACGHEFNLNSPKQLAEVLYDELHLPIFKKTKTGRSTDESVLQQLYGAHPCIEYLFTYRELFKLKSTYIDAWGRYMGKDSRIHSTFRAGGAVTGRLSSSEPNLQNIPIKGEWGVQIRKAVIAPKGYELVSADYSQIELRVMAHMADDEGLQQAFAQGQDIHTVTASSIFEVERDDVTTQQRRAAKTIVFGLMYGMGAHSLARNLTRSRLGTVDHQIARLFIDRYFAQFPKVLEYMKRTIEQGKERGYVETLLGRKRLLPELSARDGRIRAAGERMAINFPIQGTAADIINSAMVDIFERLMIQKNDSALILQVHDELLFETPADEVFEVASMAKDIMEHAITLSVPLVVDVRHGHNWGEMVKVS